MAQNTPPKPRPFAAAIEAAGLEAGVRDWLKKHRKSEDQSPGSVLAMAQHKGAAFAAEVQRQFKPTKARTVARIIAKSKAKLRQDLKAEGIKGVVIPDKAKHMQAAVAALVRYADAGRKPSASAAARQPGLDDAQARKLARGRVSREAVNAGICLAPSSSFVARLRQDPGLLALVVSSHERLAVLARTMANVQRSLAGRPDADAAVPAARGAWHARAVALFAENHSVPAIARLTGQKPDTVKKLLKRRGLLPRPTSEEGRDDE